MKTQSLKSFIIALILLPLFATAAPTIDTIRIQGFMKRASGTAVTDGTYNIAFGVFQNGTVMWGKTISTTVTSGLFSASLSGLGGNLSALPAGTGMNSNFSAVTLNPALLVAGGSGANMVRVYAVSTIDGNNPQFDIDVNSVATAFIADTANSVVSGGVSLTAIASAAKVSSSAGAGDSGKLVILDGSGLINQNMLPAIPAGTGISGQLPVANGGTGSSTASAARSALGAAASGANSDITSLTGLTTALSVAQGGTGATTASGALTALSAAASGANSDITSLTGLTTALSVAQGGTGVNSTVAGDTLYSSGVNTIAKLPIGTAGQVLTVNAGATAPQWSTPGEDPSSSQLVIFDDFMGGAASAAGGVTISNAFFPLVGANGAFAFASAATAIIRPASIVAADVNRPGILQLFSNANAVAAGLGYCGISALAGTVGNPSINFTGGAVTMEAGVRVPALGTGATYRIGFGSAAVGTTAPTKKAYFEFVGAATGQWTHRSEGTALASANVGNTFAANTWMKLSITVNAAASTITYQKDTDTAVTVSTAANIPVATDLLCPFVANVGSAASSRNFDIDYIKIVKQFSTAR